MVTGEKSSVTSSDEEMLVGVMGQSLLGLGIPESVIEPKMENYKNIKELEKRTMVVEDVFDST